MSVGLHFNKGCFYLRRLNLQLTRELSKSVSITGRNCLVIMNLYVPELDDARWINLKKKEHLPTANALFLLDSSCPERN